MSADRYPLRAAQTQRRARRASAELALGEAVQALERGQRALAQSEARLRAHRDRRPAGPATQGALSGVELARLAAFARRRESEERALVAECASGRAALAQLEARAEQARQNLATALSEEQAIERDRERHEAEQRRQAERRGEREGRDQRRPK